VFTLEQLDDKTFREIFMPLCEAAAARAGCAFVEEPLAVVMRERDAEIERLKRRLYGRASLFWFL
jgi:hypothetical protein